jgi:hypothetical protein
MLYQFLSIAVLLCQFSNAASIVSQSQRLKDAMDKYQGSMNSALFDSIKGVPVITFCNTTMEALVVNSYTWSPNDIKPGETVKITIDTTLVGETVTSGTIEVSAYDGKFPIYNGNLDLCTELATIGINCPLKPGPYDIVQTFSIPNVPISGTITATTHILDQNKKEILCMKMSVAM